MSNGSNAQTAWLTEYFLRVMKLAIKYPEQRLGQRYYNVLYTMRPDLAEKIKGTDTDPFYASKPDDERIKRFIEFVVEHANRGDDNGNY